MSEYNFKDSILTYEIESNGYKILKDGKVWLVQQEPYISDKDKTYEENAIAHIKEIIESSTKVAEAQLTMEEMQQQITDLQLALVELAEGGNV